MCGIVGGVSERTLVPLLLGGLKRLEYRGYDSAGICTRSPSGKIICLKVAGKVEALAEKIAQENFSGHLGIGHTRWATHGIPSEQNAHPHCAGDRFSVVHNGIIENYKELKNTLEASGYVFHSQTDTEVIVVGILAEIKIHGELLKAILSLSQKLKGAYAIGILDAQDPNHIYALRHGSPLVIGKGVGEQFLASDVFALESLAHEFLFLEEGEFAKIGKETLTLWDKTGAKVSRTFVPKILEASSAHKGHYRHFMLKEIYEQPEAIERTVLEGDFGVQAQTLFQKTKRIQILACGTSYYAGLVGKYWLETFANIPTQVDIASEFRYRKRICQPDTLVVAISQSGETADLLAAMRGLQPEEYMGRLGICNVAQSALVLECDTVFLTKAGREIGVASTKAFTAQLTALLLLTQKLGQQDFLPQLMQLPDLIRGILGLETQIFKLAKNFASKNHALFLGRKEHFPVALEGALKLKEISYIHAEAYPAGELKHGPLALVDNTMPVVVLAPNNPLLEKIQSNVSEICARGGNVFLLTEQGVKSALAEVEKIELPAVPEILSPIAYTVPLQLLAYHVAVAKGTDVDQPRNLAKSVTVE